ncbi:IMP dehydrogenase [Candidatus Woesearchaeota archaeon]|nr:MAG: IMP dehydrogenase [Candidatus Woesearchaeota archaeon]
MAGEVRIERPSMALSEFLLLPGKTSEDSTIEKIIANNGLRTPLVKYERGEKPALMLNRPFLSAAMQAVTGPKMCIALADRGGLGVIYRSQPVELQAAMVEEVKSTKAGFVKTDTFSPEHTIADVVARVDEVEGKYSTFPITDDGTPNGRLVGLLTRNDYDRDDHRNLKVKERMVPLDKLVVGIGITDLKSANRILKERHVGNLPIIDNDGRLMYMVFKKDLDRHMDNPHQLTDPDSKQYLVGAAFDTHDFEERVPALVDAGVDVLFLDTSDAYTHFADKAIRFAVKNFEGIPVVGGNIVTKEGFAAMVKAGASAVKVGMSSGSICSTRQQKGVGRGQASALIDVAEERDSYFKTHGTYVPIIADGGIVSDTDIIIALALGADAVMMGRYFAQFEESPTDVIRKRFELPNGIPVLFNLKPYWGEGSRKAQLWREGRYGHSTFEEGIEGFVPYLGPMKATVEQTVDKIVAAMSNAGCATIRQLHEKAVVERMSESAITETKPHDIVSMNLFNPYSSSIF